METKTTDRPNEAARCKSCQRWIYWVHTKGGKLMPIDAHTGSSNDKEFNPDRHTSHFATCPHADGHRRPRRQGVSNGKA